MLLHGQSFKKSSCDSFIFPFLFFWLDTDNKNGARRWQSHKIKRLDPCIITWSQVAHQPGHPERVVDMRKIFTLKSEYIFESVCCSLAYPDFSNI